MTLPWLPMAPGRASSFVTLSRVILGMVLEMPLLLTYAALILRRLGNRYVTDER